MIFQKLKDKLTEAKNRKNCESGKHRWGQVIEKTGDGQKLESHICQSCGVKDETQQKL